MKYEFEFDHDLMVAVLSKAPKDPWSRFTAGLNETMRTSHSEGFLRIVRAIAEDQLDSLGRECGKVSEHQFAAIRAGIALGHGHSEIARFSGASMSTVSRLYRVGVNLEYSQIKEMADAANLVTPQQLAEAGVSK